MNKNVKERKGEFSGLLKEEHLGIANSTCKCLIRKSA